MRGFALPELVIVLAIVAVLSVAALSVRESNERERDLEFVRQGVDEILSGLNSYYYAHCKDGFAGGVTVDNLKGEGFIALLPDNRIGEPYQVEVDDSLPATSIKVSMVVSVPGPLEGYRSALGATDSDPASNTLVWERRTKRFSGASESSFVQFAQMYETPCN